MSNATPIHPKSSESAKNQPKLADLMAKYLNQQATAQGSGLASFSLTGEVVPFDAGPVQPVDPRPAWEEALAVAPFFTPGIKTRSWPAPPDWPQLVSAQEPTVALAFCLGNYPQLMRDFHVIMNRANLSKLRPGAGKPMTLPALMDWTKQVADKKQFPQLLLALGALRLAKQYDRAGEIIKTSQKAIPQEWRAAWANEEAALAWHSGRADEALKLWQQQEPSVPVLFNRGMAGLFLGKVSEAKAALTAAVNQLPEAGAWHHLCRLYLALAQ
jgi:tetratricopeptide (TPR) repeat protein